MRKLPFPSLARDERGVTLVEFAILSPVLMVMILGFADTGHTLYMRASMQGAVQKIARDATLQESATEAGQTALDNRVRASVMALANNATVTFNRRHYRTFTDAAEARAEVYYDTNSNQRCDNDELYDDRNNNGVWDADGGDAGQGGAKDKTVYTVTISYPPMIPYASLNGSAANTTVKAVTVLQNQPYDDQSSEAAATQRHCA